MTISSIGASAQAVARCVAAARVDEDATATRSDAPPLPPETIARINEEARVSCFEALSPKVAALGAHLLAAEARTSPRLHAYLREHCIEVRRDDDARTIGLKLQAFDALTRNLPTLDREPGEPPLPPNQRALARLHLSNVLHASRRLDRLAQYVQGRQLAAISGSVRSEREWFEACDDALSLKKRDGLSAKKLAPAVAALADKLPPKAEKRALIRLAELRQGVDAPSDRRLYERLRPAIDRLPPEQHEPLLVELGLQACASHTPTREELEKRLSAIAAQREQLAEESATIQARLARLPSIASDVWGEEAARPSRG